MASPDQIPAQKVPTIWTLDSVRSFLLFALQACAAFFVGLFYYLIAVGMTTYDGGLSLLGHFIMGPFFSTVAVLTLLIIGLPIRLIKPLYLWWKTHWWISFILGALGFALMCLSWLPYFRIQVVDPELDAFRDSFHPIFASSGWLITIFAVLHFPLNRWLFNRRDLTSAARDG